MFKEKGLDIKTASPTELSMINNLARERMLAVGFILGADRSRHGGMIREFENAYTAGRDEWLKTFTDAYRVMSNWIRNKKKAST